MSTLRFAHSVVLLALLAQSSVQAQTPDRPVRAVTDPGVVTTRQNITPAGVPLIFDGRVYASEFTPSGDELWILNGRRLYRVDWRAGKVLESVETAGTPSPQGLAMHGGRPLAAILPRRGKSGLFTVEQGKLQTVAAGLGDFNAGGPAAAGNTAVVPNTAKNVVSVVDLATGQTRGRVATGIAPFAATINQAGTVAYVSEWGGRVPHKGERTSTAGTHPDADPVLVNEIGVTASGTVSRVDLATLKATHSIAVGLHPNGLAWDEPRHRLYVASNNSDSVTVVDTNTNLVMTTIALKPFAENAPGIAPTSVAVARDGRKLFVTCGGINAIAVVDAASGHLDGMVPTAWYPGAIALSPDGKHLAVSTVLGAGSGWRDKPANRFVHSNRGSVHVIEIPSTAQLASFTTAVAENNHLSLAGSPITAPRPRDRTPRAVPLRAGDASKIEHVVYIVRENRTYDQILGDMAKGNSDPSLLMFGPDVTPNAHRLADQFVLLDNFYASGGNSADGHQWATQANEVSYALWPGYQGRSYPFDGTDPMAIARGGTIWDAAIKLGKPVRIYGEYAGTTPSSGTTRPQYLAQWKSGKDFSTEWNVKAPIAHMNAVLAHNFPPYSNEIPDVVRAGIFLRDLKQWESDGRMPALTVMAINCDHTSGTTPGASTPKAMVADNDLALGQIVDALTRSKFWPKMAIFVVEDDAQNGVDHVDGHRTVALAISPYTRRGHVDSTFYSQQSILKTIELMLGLPTLSLFDLIANDMRASFRDEADVTPYDHAVPKQDLFERNPAAAALKGKPRKAAIASAKMRWDVPDAVPSDRLNRILWHNVRGWNTPYPGTQRALFAPLSIDVDDDDR